ncbi:MAG: hypothetical protein J5769_03940 [Bacteroidales bacterium]|nr:hypothetical protein [Bacteroidales bacterium]
MNPFLSFFVGPFGAAFSVMDEYLFLPSPENFTEFTEEMYEVYFIKNGMPGERMYQMHPGTSSNPKEILTISKTEMSEMLRAREFVDRMVSHNRKLKNASDLDKLHYFISKFPFLFPKKTGNE